MNPIRTSAAGEPSRHDSSHGAGSAAAGAVFVDANPTLAGIAAALLRPDDQPFAIHRNPDVSSDRLPEVLAGAAIALIDHTSLPADVARRCPALRHVVFLGTGARSYMCPEALRALGIEVHTISGYGDTAVAECAMALMWAAARDLAAMDRGIRAGRWVRTDALQLTGRTLGLLGFGGIAAELARLALGIGMRVIAWNRSPKSFAGVGFVSLERLLADSDVLSLHLLLTDETRGFLSRERIASMRRGAILVNTARGALVDEDALVDALRSGYVRHAGLDVFAVEPLPRGHVLASLDNVTLSAHSGFRTAEANRNLIEAALAHCRRIRAAEASRA
jgi:D-3-phosphoglycerate dehydrogenase